MDRRHLELHGTGLKNPTMSAEHQIAFLQDAVGRLEEELYYATEEAKRCSEQRNCLMLLVKRAWTGDETAATNLANIVGVAPPEISKVELHEDVPNGKADGTGDAKCVHTSDVVYMENKQYKQLEAEQAQLQHEHLLQRQAYLDTQLVMDNGARKEERNGVHRPSSDQQQHRQARVGSAKSRLLGECRHFTSQAQNTRPTSGHLYRPAVKSESKETLQSALSNLYINALQIPAKGNQEEEQGMWSPTKSNTTNEVSYSSAERPRNAFPVRRHNSLRSSSSSNMWAEPARVSSAQTRQTHQHHQADRKFSHDNLYDAATVIGPNSRAIETRVTSAKQQRMSDAMRSQPKGSHLRNALTQKQNRPQSAAVNQKTALGPLTASMRGRISSAPQDRQRKPLFITMQGQEIYKNNQPSPRNDKEYFGEESADGFDTPNGNELDIDLTQLDIDSAANSGHQNYNQMHLQNPKVVDGLETAIRNTKQQEKDFKEATKQLQKKLGIDGPGMIS